MMHNFDMENARVLVLDDEKNIVTVLKAILEKRGITVDGFTMGREAFDALRKNNYDATITDLYMPEIDGMAFLEEAKRLYPGLPGIMITAFGTVDSAVDAIKKGAFDYVTKPFEQSEIVSVVQKAINSSRLKKLEVGAESINNLNATLLNGSGPVLAKLHESINRVAPTPATVLICGETGAGKEYVAEEIHRKSDRAFQPMLKINCAAVSDLTLEADLFGGQKPGKLEMADKGTLFIDDISEMPYEVQSKFLDFLETGSFENPAARSKQTADVRVIASTQRDLAKMVKEGLFREGLFYKLNVMPITVPSLRDRKDDIQALAQFFIERLNKKLHREVQGIDAKCLEAFQAATWPGNIRQLEQTLERMILLCKGSTLTKSDIPADLVMEMESSVSSNVTNFREIVKKQTQNLEKDLIERALDEMDGNVTKTAEHLGISRKGLQLKMKELGIK